MDPPQPPPSTTTFNYSGQSKTASWGEHNSLYPSSNHSSLGSSLGSVKLRFMCSSGGHIVPRPHDNSLCYVGGETRMVAVDRHTTLLDLTHRLSKSLFRSYSSSFTLKYKLPSEDLDSLISVSTDEDLENMIEEYDRLKNSSSATGSKSSRLRLFIFPITQPENVSSSKSEDWFVDALNGTSSGFSDTSSVNCLLGLDDEIPDKKDVNHKASQDVQSVPDSPMMGTTSSFGSASSTPALMVVSGSPMAVPEHSDRVLSYHDRSEQGLQMGYINHQHQQHQIQHNQSTGFEFSDRITTDRSSPVAQIQSSDNNNQSAFDPNDIPDQNTRIQMLQQHQIQDSAYLPSMPTTQADAQHPQLNHQQLQFIHTAVPPPPQYIHHHQPAPAASYYPTMGHPNLVYYRQPAQGYNFPLQPNQAPPKTDFTAGVYTTANSGGPQLVRVLPGHQNQGQHVYYATQPLQYQTAQP